MSGAIELVGNSTTLKSVIETTEKSPETSQRILDFGFVVYKYYTPLLFFFGVVGNSLSLLVFHLDPKYRRKSSSCYLTALAISDTGYLLNLFAVWLGSLNKGVITNAFTCPLVMYLGQVTCFVTVYLTVAFSVERYIAIYFPLRKLQLCTASKAKKVICGILTTALILFAYVWWIAEVVESKENGEINYVCAVPYRHHKISERANYLDSIFTFIIPFFVITFLNVKVAIKLYQDTANRRTASEVSVRFENLMQSKDIGKISLPKLNQCGRDIVQVVHIPIAITEGVEVATNFNANVYRNPYAYQYISRLTETRVTKTLLLVSVTFLCLNIPLHILRSAQFILQKTGSNTEGIKVTLAFQPWAMMLFNTNFAVNFSLYCMSGKGFRSSLRTMFARAIYKVFCEKKF